MLEKSEQATIIMKNDIYLINNNKLLVFASKRNIKDSNSRKKNLIFRNEKISYIIIIALLILLYIILYIFLVNNKEYRGMPNLKNQNNKNLFITLENTSKIINITTEEDSSSYLAKIVVQNKIYHTPKISVIIPFFNIEINLHDYLETIFNQSLKEMEIIFVDNGSTDNSLYFLKKYAEKDFRISIIKQEKINFGLAFNIGLKIARGEYLYLTDSNNYLELNTLEEMYKKITKEKSDIIICKTKVIDLDNRKEISEKLNDDIKIDLIPKNITFSVSKTSNSIFNFCQGWTWDKLFKKDFILSNNIQFPNLKNSYDIQFTYTALCFAHSVTTINKRFIIKNQRKNILFPNYRLEDSSCFLFALDGIKSNLERKGLYNSIKENFLKFSISFCIIQLKTLDENSKRYLFNFLHERFKSLDYTNNFFLSQNQNSVLNYIKSEKVFPSISVAYTINKSNFKFFLVSLVSLLYNSEFENINIILLYNDINEIELQKINELKEIHFFTLKTLKVRDEEFQDFPYSNESWYKYLLADNFPSIDKILYLHTNTIVRRNLLSLWKLNINNNLIGGVEDFSYIKNKSNKLNFKDGFFINNNLLLINAKEWRKIKIYNKSINFIERNSPIIKSSQDFLNILTDTKKANLSNYLNFLEVKITNDNSKNYYESLELHKSKDPDIIYYKDINFYINTINISFIFEYLKYDKLLNSIKYMHLSIPIVLSSDNNYAPYMYTTMISILENANKNTFFKFFLLVPSNFSKTIENQILLINDKYKCSINFIYIKNEFENLNINKLNNSFYNYHLLAGDLLPNEIDKCIYLDIDVCVCKDLSKLYTINLKNNYIAGVATERNYSPDEKNFQKLKLSSMNQYINTGMLVMNLKQIRKDNMTQKFIELSKLAFNYQDQDILNIACKGKIQILPPKYNAMVNLLKENNPIIRKLYNDQEILEARNKPYIVHYSNKKKPWNSIGIYMEKYWWDTAKKTPYMNNIFNRIDIYKRELKNWWYIHKKKPLNLENPQSFNEKIQWLKLYNSIPIKTQLTDKYLVRRWVAEKIGEEYLIPLLGVYNEFEEINFDELPNQFVIKCNHGSAYNIIVKDKAFLNYTDAKSKIDKWMNENYAFRGLELQYKNIAPKVIVEKYMDDGSGDLKDYKITCFNGKPYLLWIDINRHSNHKRNLYDLNWNILPYKINPKIPSFPPIDKPIFLNKMIEIASILSKGFAYVRVDLYAINDKIYFGEMTFTSSSGTSEIIPMKFDRKLASLIKLPKEAYNIDSGEYYKLSKSFSFYPFNFFFIFLLFKLIKIYKKK